MPWSDAPGHVPLSNQILAALPPQEYQRLADSCEPVPLLKDAILYGPGQPIPYVFFPTSGLISFLMVLRNGTAIEVGMVGREGMAGLPIVLGTETSSARCLVQIPGEALRVASEILRTHLERNSLLQRLLLRFAHAFLARVTQLVACNSQHTVAQCCCCWLLLTHDRGQAGQFPMTHEFLANMLGVRRASVTEVVGFLRQQGLIRYGRGKMTILDRAKLEAAACECYSTIRAEYDRLP